MLTAALTLAACGRSVNVDKQLKQIDSIASPSKRLAALVKLDSTSPNSFEVKRSLADLYLYLGQIDVATVYLAEAVRLTTSQSVPKEEARKVTVEYARALIIKGKSAQAVTVISPLAKSGDPDALLVRARAYEETNRMKNAVSDFQHALAEKPTAIAPSDFTLYAEALMAQKNYQEALRVLGEGQHRFGFQPGQGFLASTLYEDLGQTVHSILAAFEETLYQESVGNLTSVQIETNLSALARSTQINGVIADRAQLLIRGLKEYAAGKWRDAERDLSVSLKGVSLPFASYLLATARFETGQVSAGTLAGYVSLEPQFQTYPDFYYHLWKAMKVGPGSYTFANAHMVIEKAILLAPESGEARASRAELGRLLGLKPSDAQKLLLRQQIDAIYAKLSQGANPAKTLAPVIELLSINKENVYTSDGVLMLKTASQIPAVAAFLKDKLQSATGVLKQRLSQVL